MRIIDELIFHKLDPDAVSLYIQDKALVKSMKLRVANGHCMHNWCPSPLYEDGLCQGHYEEAVTPKTVTITQVDDPRQCKTVNCKELIVKDDLCSGCYTLNLEAIAAKQPSQPTPLNEELAKELDLEAVEEMVDLDWWYMHYGEKELPAKYINPDFYRLENWDKKRYGEPDKYRLEMAELSKRESMWLNDKLKELDGVLVNNGTHVWTFVGRKHYKREGQQNHFACLPV